MSDKIIKFRVTKRVKKAFTVILIMGVVLGLSSLIGGIVASTWMPKPSTEEFYLDYGEEEAIILTAEAGQFIYFAVETDDEVYVILMEYDDYMDGGGWYELEQLDSNNGFECKYEITESGQYVILAENYEYGTYDYGVLSYVVFDNTKILQMVLYIGMPVFILGGMATALTVAAINDAKLKKKGNSVQS